MLQGVKIQKKGIFGTISAVLLKPLLPPGVIDTVETFVASEIRRKVAFIYIFPIESSTPCS
jgi:hypothetical protein